LLTHRFNAIGFQGSSMQPKNKKYRSPLPIAWVYLSLAIATEVLGLTAMKICVSMGRIEGLVLLYMLITLSYFFLAKAVKSISVGVAYAIWEGSGIALVTLVSAILFQQILTLQSIVGLLMVVVGNVMIHAGEVRVPSVHFTKAIANE
jgi:spermidine export protein MdtJ